MTRIEAMINNLRACARNGGGDGTLAAQAATEIEHLHGALHKIAIEPIGPSDASWRKMCEGMILIAANATGEQVKELEQYSIVFRGPVKLEFPSNGLTIATVRVILPDRQGGWNAQTVRDFIRGR